MSGYSYTDSYAEILVDYDDRDDYKNSLDIEKLAWGSFCVTVFQYYYFMYYKMFCRRIEASLTIIGLVTGSAAIARWPIWGNYPYLLTLLIAAGQIVQCLRPILPWQRHHSKLHFLLPEARKICNRIEKRYIEYLISNQREVKSDCLKEIGRLRRRFTAMCDSCYDDDDMPEDNQFAYTRATSSARLRTKRVFDV